MRDGRWGQRRHGRVAGCVLAERDDESEDGDDDGCGGEAKHLEAVSVQAQTVRKATFYMRFTCSLRKSVLRAVIVPSHR